MAWLLNIRGSDTPFSPLPNCNLILSKNRKMYLITDKHKIKRIIKEKKISSKQFINKNKFKHLINDLKGKKFIVDNKTLSVFNEDLIKSKFLIIDRNDPCYILKSKKNPVEIKNMIQSHISDGVALTKFIIWIKNLKIKN